jgi:hypothetical protein
MSPVMVPLVVRILARDGGPRHGAGGRGARHPIPSVAI